MKNQSKIFLSVALIHFVTYMTFFLLDSSYSWDAFENIDNASTWTHLIQEIHETLSFPIISSLFDSKLRFPGIWGYIPIISNSLLWSACIIFISKIILKLKNA